MAWHRGSRTKRDKPVDVRGLRTQTIDQEEELKNYHYFLAISYIQFQNISFILPYTALLFYMVIPMLLLNGKNVLVVNILNLGLRDTP